MRVDEMYDRMGWLSDKRYEQEHLIWQLEAQIKQAQTGLELAKSRLARLDNEFYELAEKANKMQYERV